MTQTLIERFGDEAAELPKNCQWLTDNGSGYIARETIGFARDIGLDPAVHRIDLRRATAWPRRS